MPSSVTPTDETQLRPAHKQRRFASLRAIGALILREMSTTNGRTAHGYVWAVAEPVGGIILLTIIFSLGFRSPPMGTNFAIFYATGLVPFMFYMSLSGKVAQSIQYSKSLLAYPAVTFMDALLARIFFNTVTQILVSYLIFTGIYLTQETRTDPQITGIALSLLMAFVISVGAGTLNCFLFAAFPWWQSAWSILTRPLFIISGIFFIFDDVPKPYQDYLWFNPLTHVVGQMRKSFYPSYIGDYVSPVYIFSVGLTLMAIGLALLVRYHRDLLNS
ncbi:ABC transporter permease [Paracoccus saliphilus]|uniref:Transport permease protein n=1 Tax=Paracoccus saliphilus TaxID=405559 RepID=A0AA45W8P8_9RHOB|nr:ABC transporter permease [Paracoccus saliphilus]WCR05491.1 ABC transporter permease [Paracoccus saliphilus]SIT18243.1 capsular polysaccharide transport system permease protein [Paracoccus saliphilus]